MKTLIASILANYNQIHAILVLELFKSYLNKIWAARLDKDDLVHNIYKSCHEQQSNLSQITNISTPCI